MAEPRTPPQPEHSPEPHTPGAARAPGDVAPAGTPGTGENVCPICHGSGRIGRDICGNCQGSGKVIDAIGGA